MTECEIFQSYLNRSWGYLVWVSEEGANGKNCMELRSSTLQLIIYYNRINIELWVLSTCGDWERERERGWMMGRVRGRFQEIDWTRMILTPGGGGGVYSWVEIVVIISCLNPWIMEYCRVRMRMRMRWLTIRQLYNININTINLKLCVYYNTTINE